LRWYNIHTLLVKKFKLYKGDQCAFLSSGPDARFVESDHKVAFRELFVQFDQFLVASFIPILGSAPLFIELIPNRLRLVEGNVLVHGTPCAVQSAGNPTIDKVWVRVTPRRLTVNLRTHGKY